MNALQIVSVALAVVVVANFVLLVFRKVSLRQFWMIILVAGFFAYIGLPYLKKKLQ
jgi:hypothetical protein